jgi:hypothetical protein
VFIKPNRRSLPYGDAVSLPEDYLYTLREVHGEGRYPRSARQYLEDWSGGQTPYLRKYYPERQFVGTESPLLSVLALLAGFNHRPEPSEVNL